MTLILLLWRRSIRLPRESKRRDGFSFCLSALKPMTEPVRSSCEGIELEPSVDVIEEPGEGRGELEVVVLLLDRPLLKTDRRLGLWAWAVDRERLWTGSGGSFEDRVGGRSLCPLCPLFPSSSCHWLEGSGWLLAEWSMANQVRSREYKIVQKLEARPIGNARS